MNNGGFFVKNIKIRGKTIKGQITRAEFNRRLGYILLGFFTYYLVEPIRNWTDNTFGLNPIIIGILGIVVVLYLFDF